METMKLTIALFLCLGLAIYLAILLGKALNTLRRTRRERLNSSSEQKTTKGQRGES